jgi:ammonium transporter, Amt family
MGMVDFSGSGVIHITGGSTALYAAYILGARRGRFYDSRGRPLSRPGLTKGHSVALQMLGTMLLWFCWYGFNSGSALLLNSLEIGNVAARAAVNTTLAAAAGALSALITNGFLVERRTGEFVLDIVMSMNGCLSGLVAITAGCGVVDEWAALFIGVASGWVYIAADAALIHFKIDDAVSAIPVHFANGFWGVIATGLFAAPKPLKLAFGTDEYPGLFYAGSSGGKTLLLAQLVGAVWIILWTFITMFPFFLLLDFMGWFRVNELEELVGLDTTYGNSPEDEDEASENEELRLAAYRQRFEERRLMRESNKPVQTMTVGELLNDSFFGAAQAMAAKMEPGPSLDNLVPDNIQMTEGPKHHGRSVQASVDNAGTVDI